VQEAIFVASQLNSDLYFQANPNTYAAMFNFLLHVYWYHLEICVCTQVKEILS